MRRSRKKRLTVFVTSAVVAASAPSFAQQGIEGVYARSPELCTQAKGNDGLQALFEAGETVLTNSGIEGIEYHCDFIDMKASTRTLGWVVTALCEEPGYAFPDVLVIMPRGEGELELTSVRPAGEDGDAGNAGLYHHCAGVPVP